LYEPNFIAAMPYPEQYSDPEEDELLGVEYAYCQSTVFSSQNCYNYYFSNAISNT